MFFGCKRELSKMTSILVAAAHPDDEILGCGGTVALHAEWGDRIHVLIVGEGATSRGSFSGPDTRDQELCNLEAATARAASIVGAEPPRMLGLTDNCLDTVPLLDIVKAVEAMVDTVAPEVVYTHHAGDLNVDHRLVHQAVVTACRPLPGSSVRAIYAFETPSSTEWQTTGDRFQPQRWVDIAPFLGCKLRALEAYEVEMREFPHPRSYEAVEALARVRGAAAGLKAAECFMVVRELVR